LREIIEKIKAKKNNVANRLEKNCVDTFKIGKQALLIFSGHKLVYKPLP
jgi:hypothetical protein